MKRIGYISAARIKGSIDTGPGGSLTVHGATILALGVNVYGASLLHSSLAVAGATTLNAPVACNSSLGVAGPSILNGAVICSSTLAIAGILTMSPIVMATLLPAADPTLAGQLWVDAGVVTRSAG